MHRFVSPLCCSHSLHYYSSGDAGKWSGPSGGNGKGVLTCSDCPAGRYSLAKAQACSACEKGTFNGRAGKPSCSECAAGREASEPGALRCESCLEGKFSSRSRSIRCDDCEKGKFASRNGRCVQYTHSH